MLGVITGNIGPEAVANIDSTLYTLQQAPWWNLNHYFTNDDQNIFETNAEGFYVQDSILHMQTRPVGEHTADLSATDPQDPNLQTSIEASVLIQYTMQIPDQMLAEDSKQEHPVERFERICQPGLSQPFEF
ncbi:MAG: hypothetical protein U5Q03_02595 [Bacteroidota bacterium]|nr:hypothetical protein [Bacteroidota bacterium]